MPIILLYWGGVIFTASLSFRQRQEQHNIKIIIIRKILQLSYKDIILNSASARAFVLFSWSGSKGSSQSENQMGRSASYISSLRGYNE
jgi:hypothetical protein